MHIVDLLAVPNLSLRQPADGGGILVGALPTAEAILKGTEQITPELMSIGYATGKVVVPDYTGEYHLHLSFHPRLILSHSLCLLSDELPLRWRAGGPPQGSLCRPYLPCHTQLLAGIADGTFNIQLWRARSLRINRCDVLHAV